MALERIRFATGDPAELSRDLDRFVESVKTELERLESRTVRRYRPREGGPASADFSAHLDELARVQSMSGDVRVLLPRPTAADAGRSLLIDRMSSSNAVTLQPAGTHRVNGTTSLALPALVGAFPILWTGSEWRTTEGQ